MGESEGRRKQRLQKRHALHREERRFLLLQAALVGALAGVLGVAFQFCVSLAEAGSLRAAATASHFGVLGMMVLLLCTTATGAGVAYATGCIAPEAGGSGIPHIKAALLHLRIIRPIRILAVKFLGGLAVLSAGFSLGREGPTIQMGAAIGKLFGLASGVSRRGRSSLIASGAGAGLAAAFNAPLAGFLFVMEELRREMSALTYGSALAASVCAVAVTRLAFGSKASFALPTPGTPPLSVLPWVAGVGVVCGCAGVLFNKTILAALEVRTRFALPRWVYGAVVGVLSGLALLFVPGITGGGHKVAEELLAGQFPGANIVAALLVVFLGKLLLTGVSYGTGVPGGIFAPILVLGSVLGYLLGICIHSIAPHTLFSPAGFATIGMAALLAGAVRAPLTGVVLIVEMTAEYGLLYSLLVGAFAASLVAEALRDKPIYDALMERDLHLSGAEIHPDEEPMVLEILIEPHSTMDGVRVKNLRLPVGAILTTVERDSRHLIPGGSTLLKAGDMVTVLVEGDKPEISLQVHEASKAP